MTVYKTLPAPVPMPANGQVTGAYAKGCFEDKEGDRTLGGHSFDSDSMTAQVKVSYPPDVR